MTCRAARRLLPLYAGGDLNAPRTSAVAAHVAMCAACRAEVEAFTAALSLLPLSSLSFGESERATVRRRVLDEIARHGSPSPTLASLLRPRYALAALAGIVVLAASLVSPFFVRNPGEREDVIPVPGRPALLATPAPAGALLAEAAPPAQGPSTAISPKPLAKRAFRPPVPASENPGPGLRFEIQTGNVNVRIIWFAGGSPGGEQPSGQTSDTNDVS